MPDAALAGPLSALRKRLVVFLRSHLETDFSHYRRSMAWTDLACAGFEVRAGVREREPTADQWCAGLSDLEILFETMDCLFVAHVRMTDWLLWLDKRGSGLELWESYRLPEGEEETLLAELGINTRERAAAVARVAWQEYSSGGGRGRPAASANRNEAAVTTPGVAHRSAEGAPAA